jgi:hypothetical protein
MRRREEAVPIWAASSLSYARAGPSGRFAEGFSAVLGLQFISLHA